MTGSTQIVIVGGGYAGVEAAKRLHKEFRKQKNVEITVIDRNPYHTLMTELHEVAGGRVDEDSVKVPFRKIFGGLRVNVIVDAVRTIDFENRRIMADHHTLDFDYLVLGTGAEPEFFGIPGVEEHSFKLWSLDDARLLREHIQEMFLRASREPDSEKRREMLTFVVAGAGFTGIEMAGELLDWKSSLALQNGLDESEVRVVVVEALSKILPTLPDPLIVKAAKHLEKRGAELLLNSPIASASEDFFTLKDGTEFRTKTLVWTCGVQGGRFAANLILTKGRCTNRACTFATTQGTCGLKDCQFGKNAWIEGRRGRLKSNEFMQSVDYPYVFIAGDIIWHLENGKAVPQIVETALQTAHCAAENLIAMMHGKPLTAFKSDYHGFMISLGSRYGVANVGMGTSFMKLSGFFAMASKHLINLHYLWGVAGVNQCWAYLRHEFFDNREGKSIIGSHAAAKVPLYWTVPLRMFLGAKWLYEGVKKVMEGWLNPGAGGIFNAAAKSVRMPGVKFGAAGTADAVTAATGEVVETAADAVTAASDAVLETAAPVVEQAVDAMTAASDAVVDAAQTVAAAAAAESNWLIDFFNTIFVITDRPRALTGSWGVYDWFAQNILSISPSFAFIMQSIVVIAEIAIGLALISGTFTFLSAVASIGLGIMFIMSGWGNPELLWYMVAALVMLGGAGRGFGLDYWIMPWLKKGWNGTALAKRTYLYVGEPRKVKTGVVKSRAKEAVLK